MTVFEMLGLHAYTIRLAEIRSITWITKMKGFDDVAATAEYL